MHPIVIIGSGMAGYTLAREFRKLNPDHELLMICADDAVNYAKPTLSNALVGNKAPEQIQLGDAEKCQHNSICKFRRIHGSKKFMQIAMNW
jgi:rubredoxin-NAD+ reductase